MSTVRGSVVGLGFLVACGAGNSESGAGGAGSSGANGGGASGPAAGGTGGDGGLGGFATGAGGLGGFASGGNSAVCQPGAGGSLPATDCAASGIIIAPEFASDYECVDLGEVLSLPPKWGGLTTKAGDTSRLLIGGSANTDAGALYEIGIHRDADCHVEAFSAAPPTLFSEAAYNDGGVVYGPGGVLFLARWPVNEIGFLKPGSTATDKVIDTDPLGVAYSLAALNFVPTGFGNEGGLKFVAWPGGEFYSVAFAEDGMGTFDIDSVTYTRTLVGGPEGFVYIEAGNAQFPANSMLVSEWSANNISAYTVDENGDPDVNSRRDFITGLQGAEGAFLDPVSGDFLFSTFATVNRVIAIRGFKPPPPVPQ